MLLMIREMEGVNIGFWKIARCDKYVRSSGISPIKIHLVAAIPTEGLFWPLKRG